MTNETVKRGIKKSLAEKEIDCNKIQFSKVEKSNGDVTCIGKITISINDVTGVELDMLKYAIDGFLDVNNINYMGILLDI